jgi:hypothetical protein
MNIHLIQRCECSMQRGERGKSECSMTRGKRGKSFSGGTVERAHWGRRCRGTTCRARWHGRLTRHTSLRHRKTLSGSSLASNPARYTLLEEALPFLVLRMCLASAFIFSASLFLFSAWNQHPLAWCLVLYRRYT